MSDSEQFLKSLIQLLAACGGTFTCPLADLTPLGLELTLAGFGSSAPTLTLRLGARIYYVPATATTTAEHTPQEDTASWPTTSNGSLKPNASEPVEDALRAVTTLNNRVPLPQPSLLPPLPPPLPPPESSEATSLAPTAPLHRPVRPSDLDLYLIEQRRQQQRLARAEAEAQAAARRGQQFPWETRRPQ